MSAIATKPTSRMISTMSALTHNGHSPSSRHCIRPFQLVFFISPAATDFVPRRRSRANLVVCPCLLSSATRKSCRAPLCLCLAHLQA